MFTSVPRDVRVNTDSGSITLVLPRGDTKYHVTANTDSGNVDDTLPQATRRVRPQHDHRDKRQRQHNDQPAIT